MEELSPLDQARADAKHKADQIAEIMKLDEKEILAEILLHARTTAQSNDASRERIHEILLCMKHKWDFA